MATGYSDLEAGTSVTWTNTGGTKVLNGKALADAGVRQGDKSATLRDATKGLPEILTFVVETKLQAAPTAGKELALYVGFSSSATAGTGNPAGLGGADAAGPNADALGLLTFVGAVVCSNNIGTGIQRQDAMSVRPKNDYVIPVIQNSTGQTTSNVDGETLVTMTPWYRRAPVA